MRRVVSSWFLLMVVLPSSSLAQVIIREKVQIQPAPRLITTSTASSVSYFSPPTFLTPAVGLPRVALPSNITVGGTIDFAPSQLELRQWALLRLTGVGQTAVELHYIEKTASGQIIERKGTFSGPVGVCGGGVPQLQTFDGSVGGSSIQFDNSGNQVTYTLTGGVRQGPSRFVVPVTATVTSSASAQPGFELALWAIGPSQDSLVGSGSATLTITALNASGDQYSVCTTSNADATVTVSIQAQGAYAFLRGPDGQEGSSITLSFLVDGGFSGVKSCSLVLDESRGSIPGGRDVATVTVTGGPTATKQIVLRRALDHLFVEMGPPDVDFGSTSFVFVTAVNVYGSGVDLADETMIRLTMDQPEYGTFIDLEGNERDIVDVSYYDAYVGNIQFFATETNPEEEFKPVKITATALVDGVQATGMGQVMVKRYKPRCAVVVFESDTLAPGDTTRLSFEAPEGEDGFTEDQRFDVHIFGKKGTLLAADGKAGNDLSGLSGQIRYIAPDTSLTVQLAAKTSPPSGPPVIISSVAGPGEVALGSNGVRENAVAALENVCVVSEVVVMDEKFEIMLGESKYYYAVFAESGKLKIRESIGPPTQAPEVVADFTVNAIAPSDTLAVYWEKKYALYSENNTFAGMVELPAGVIRLVGRYWEQGRTYRVKLNASHEGKTGESVIEVKKPARLGESYATTKDVKNNDFDIDESVIKFAGENGIPPQFIKGQMFKEANKTGGSLNPSYRYEPFFDRGKQALAPDNPRRIAYLTQPFVVRNLNDIQMGEGNSIPSTDFHKNVFGRPYQRTPIAIGDYVFGNWPFYTALTSNGYLRIIGSEGEGSRTELWKEKFEFFKDAQKLDHDAAFNAATIHVQTVILNEYTEVAQSRKSASYGFLQVLYTTAIQRNIGYVVSANKTPEALNEQAELMPVYKKFIEFNLRVQFDGSNVPDFDWEHGYDETWRRVYDQYNPGERDRGEANKLNNVVDILYGARVLRNSRSFLPQAQ